ncbi:SMI1/KNR4 family protein [Kutzneria sp. CA-103260]|uniref:SMI1/KNR4 family protein n=1 Tax=Kutzneria sp. CA-103260 TaxID=2802641 RepID=UPI001BA9846E|nr:SMI1/KNR4 family protein [Kutzneria sp. CA-103260]QUQ62928.1 SMI1 / KNR4 family (SUKH-1) [Kutzneria sp. CA-103260]
MELGDAVQALVSHVHANGPTGWRTATMFYRCARSGWSGQSRYDNGWMSGARDLCQNVADALLAKADHAVYELIVRSTGEFRFSHTHDLDRTPSPFIVRDKDFWLPGHPLPGSVPMPDHAEVTDAPTDPGVLAGVGDGHSEAEILATEQELGARLPEALRALYRVGHPGLGDYRLGSLDELVEWHAGDDFTFGGWDHEDGPTASGTVPELRPYGHVKRLCRNDWWLPFAVSEDWEFLAVDLDPAPAGQPGQVLRFDENTEIAGYVADSVERLLSPWTSPDEPEPKRIANGTLDLTPAPDLQLLRTNAVAEVDMAALTVFPMLRELTVTGADRVLAADLPSLEALDLNAREFDPTPLAGTTALWSLSLRGLEHPVDARVIATISSLIRLDLSGVEVTNIEALADLPALRMLTLDKDRWTRVNLPNLAILGLDGGTLAERVAWLDRYDPLDRARGLHVLEG